MIVDSITSEELKENIRLAGTKLREEGVTQETWEKLSKTDMFKAPASTRYHSVFVGGLLDHSLGVAEWYELLRSIGGLPRNPNIRSYVVGLMHDLCKVGVYKQEYRPRKIDGKWRDVKVWEFKENYPLGHGEKSVILCEEIGLELTREEKICIRHHMGAYELTGVSLLAYQEAIRQVPDVLLLHTADMMEATYGRIHRLEGSIDETLK